jgi:glycerate-2-kinase
MNVKEIKKELKTIEKELAVIVGKNKIDTPKDLRHFIFEVLNLPTDGLLSTKSGVSVSIKELKKIEKSHPFVPLLIRYQELSKEYDKLLRLKEEQDLLKKKREEQSEVLEEIEILEETPTVTVEQVVKKDQEVLEKIEKQIESLEELEHSVLTDSKLHIIIRGEYQRMAFMIGLIALVGGFFFYAQHNYQANFIDSVANVSDAIESAE